MLFLVVLTVLLVLTTGLGIKYALDAYANELEITWREFGLASCIIVLIIAPLVALAGWHIAKGNVLSYQEYWNGWELSARAKPITCERDGSCYHDYDCDPYLVYVSKTCYDSKNNGYECGSLETRYHSCPYVDVETNYYVETTLGTFTIDTHRLPDNPQRHRWRFGHSIPRSVIKRAGTGEPEFWTRAKARTESGNAGPVTKRASYDNYILASEYTILKQYSNAIDGYLKDNLLPPLTHAVRDFYLADKVSFVGTAPENASDWQLALNRLNAALGAELQGDVHLVIVRDERVSRDRDTYAMALKAHWQDVKTFGEDSLSKNGIGIVIGTDDGVTVSWSRAFTGMPLGNEAMTVALGNELAGRALTPESIVGVIKTTYAPVDDAAKKQRKGSVQIERTDGVIASILWGDRNPATRFVRVGMTGNGTGSGSGFLYLSSEIMPTTGQQILIAVVIFILSCGIWWAVAIAKTTWLEAIH